MFGDFPLPHLPGRRVARDTDRAPSSGFAPAALPNFHAKQQSADVALRVLVVEDDPATLTLLLDVLTLLGHWATGVSTAEAAQDRFIEGAFDVVLTDLQLPGLSGLDLIGTLRRHCQVPVIVATAHPVTPDQLPTGSHWLEKPFRMADLTRALDAIRGGAPAAALASA